MLGDTIADVLIHQSRVEVLAISIWMGDGVGTRI